MLGLKNQVIYFINPDLLTHIVRSNARGSARGYYIDTLLTSLRRDTLVGNLCERHLAISL